MKTFDSPASTILVTNSDGARYDIGGSSRLKSLDSQHDHVRTVDERPVDRHAHGRVLDATPAEQAEVLLLDRRGDHPLAVHVAHPAAREHNGPPERVALTHRENTG